MFIFSQIYLILALIIVYDIVGPQRSLQDEMIGHKKMLFIALLAQLIYQQAGAKKFAR
jgi:hypothetical protein